jgi:aryl-alcohol dehydrogenase-like predicted oxidoreductase
MARSLGVGITAYGVLSRGLLGGHWAKDRVLPASDFRRFGPRFSGDNLARNLDLAEALQGLAGETGVTVAQLAIAWVAARGADVVPLVGARRRDRLAEALGAMAVTLTPGQLARIEAAVPKGAAAGERYDARGMATLDSEKRRAGAA